MIQFIIGLIVGANISLFLYACILSGVRADEKLKEKEVNREWRK